MRVSTTFCVLETEYPPTSRVPSANFWNDLFSYLLCCLTLLSLKTLTMIPAAEAVVMMRPPLPPLDLLIRSTARVIPIVAPIAITDRLRSMPACMKRVKVDLIRWRISLSSTYLTNLGTPALLHRISIFPPKTFSASSHIFIHSSFMVTSHFTKWTLEKYMTVSIVEKISKFNLHLSLSTP